MYNSWIVKKSCKQEYGILILFYKQTNNKYAMHTKNCKSTSVLEFVNKHLRLLTSIYDPHNLCIYNHNLRNNVIGTEFFSQKSYKWTIDRLSLKDEKNK